MTLPLELGGIRDPDVRRQLEIISQQFPVVATGGGGGGPETDPVASPALATHAALTTTAHGGIVASSDARLTDARTPTAHKASHEPGGADALTGLTNASIAAAAGIAKTKLAALNIVNADVDAAAGIAKTKLANLDVVNADVNAAAAIAESKLNLATDAAAGTGSRRTLGTTATSAAAGNRGLPTGGTSGQALTKNSATDYDASWSTISGGTTGNTTLDTWHAVGGAGEPAFTNSWVNYAAGYQAAGFTKDAFGRVKLRGAIKSGTLSTAAFTLPAGYRPPGLLQWQVAQAGALVEVATTGTVTIYTTNAFVDLSAVEFDTETVTTIFGWTAIPRQAADVTNATITLVNTDLVFTFAANSTYLVDLYLLATSAATTTGYALAFDVSAAVTAVGLTFEHQLAAAGTLTGGDSIADAAARALSSGVPTAAALVPILGKGILVSGANTGTCRLQFAPEVAASATFKAGSTMRVMKAA